MELMQLVTLLSISLLYHRSWASDIRPIWDRLCQRQNETLTCKKGIAHAVPHNTKTVVIKDLDFSLYVDKNPFNDESWRQVLNLTITDSGINDEELRLRKDYTINPGLFNNSYNLRYLAINSVKYTHSARGGFTGLDNLEVLDLSGCHRKTFSSLTSGLTGVMMPKLRVLKLKGFSNLTDGNTSVSIDSAFFNELKKKPITELDLSYTYIYYMDTNAFSSSFPNLRTINLEHGGGGGVCCFISLVHTPELLTELHFRRLNLSTVTMQSFLQVCFQY